MDYNTMKTTQYIQYVGGTSAAVALVGVGVFVPAVWWLSLLGFVWLPWVYLGSPLTARARVRLVFWFWMGVYGCTHWALFWHTVPLDWLHIHGWQQYVLIGSVWVLVAAIFAATTTGLYWLSDTLVGLSRWYGALIPLPYVAATVVGPLLFSVVLYGSGARIGVDFTMGLPLYLLAESMWLVQVSALGGIYVLALLQVGIGVLAYAVLFHVRTVRAVIVAALVCASIGGYALWHQRVVSNVAAAAPEVRVAVASVLTKPSLLDQSTQIAVQVQRAYAQLPIDAAVLVLPEGVSPTDLPVRTDVHPALVGIGSQPIRRSEQLYSEIEVYDVGAQQLVATSSKQFLMVFGEYLPYIYKRIAVWIGLEQTVAYIESQRQYTTGQRTVLSLPDGTPMSVLQCSDAMSPLLYPTEVRAGAEVLINLASHSWFHHSRTLHTTALQVNTVRAVEAGRWYVRAGLESPSFIISATGEVVAAATWDGTQVIEAAVPLVSVQTPYVRLRIAMVVYMLTSLGLLAAVGQYMWRRYRRT